MNTFIKLVMQRHQNAPQHRQEPRLQRADQQSAACRSDQTSGRQEEAAAGEAWHGSLGGTVGAFDNLLNICKTY